MSKQQSKDELMAEFFRMLMADAQQAQKQSAPHEEYTMDNIPRCRGIKPSIWRKAEFLGMQWERPVDEV